MATRPLRRTARPQPVIQKPRLRVVQGQRPAREKKAASRGSHLPVVVLVILSVFGVAVLQAWVGQDGLHAAALERDVQREQERLTLLRAHVAQLSSPQRLREEANKLGLVPATDPVFLKAPVSPAASTDTGSLTLEAIKRLAAHSP